MSFFQRYRGWKKGNTSERDVDETRRALIGAGPVLAAAVSVPASAAPASIPAVSGAPVPYAHVRHKGRHYPVTEQWHYDNTRRWPHLAALNHAELDAIIDPILLKSTELHRLGQLLPDEDHEYALAANNHWVIRNMIEHLDGRDHREFGFVGVDQVITNTIGPLSCDCMVMHVFDRHKRFGDVRKIFPHRALRCCDTHAHLQHDREAHYVAVLTDHGRAV